MRNRERKAWQTAIWGAVLIAAGIILLLDQIQALDLGSYWSWWPAILIVIGFASLIAAGSVKQAASGFSFVLIGLWFFACMHHWYGLTYRRAWPLLLVVFGLESVIVAVLGGRRAEPVGGEEHHA
jgi:hypothetical protein